MSAGDRIDKGSLWLVRALVALAKRKLSEANESCGECWPAGQQWNELGGSSQHAFMRAALSESGIPDAEYREMIDDLLSKDTNGEFDSLWKELDVP